jgi:hypothetical protein
MILPKEVFESVKSLTHKAFHIPYPIPKGYENFFGSDKKIFANLIKEFKLPNKDGKDFYKLTLIELENKKGFRRHIALVDNGKDRVAVVINRHDFKPDNRANHKGKEVSPHTVYGNASTVGEIIILDEKAGKPITTALDLAERESYQMTEACKEIGVLNDPNIKLSGMSAIVILDQNNPTSKNNPKFLEMISRLFGPQGPFSDAIIIPGENEELLAQIKNQGGRTLLPTITKIGDSENHINIEQFRAIKEAMLAIIRFDSSLFGINPDYLAKSFLCNIPHFMHLFEAKFSTNEEFSNPPSLLNYVANHLIEKLNPLLMSKSKN